MLRSAGRFTNTMAWPQEVEKGREVWDWAVIVGSVKLKVKSGVKLVAGSLWLGLEDSIYEYVL